MRNSALSVYRLKFRREFNNGGIGIVEMLFRCNVLAIVGGGHNPKFPANKASVARQRRPHGVFPQFFVEKRLLESRRLGDCNDSR